MESRFHWADYLVFGLSLLLSMGIGVWFACTGKKASTTDEFLMAGRNMPVFPVSMSMFVSWLSAISFLGDPVEVYTYGSIYVFLGVGYCLSLPFIAHFFAPRFHEMGLISVYEFLEKKYNRGIRLLAAFICIMITESWLAVVLYAPALALSQASGIPVWVSILCIGTICTFYTTIGGMKAVLWADSVQMLIMVAGQLAVVIQGSIRVGGMGKIWQIASEGGRTNFVSFDPNPLLRATFWTGLIGGFFRVMNPYIGTQFLVQRYSTVKTPRQAKLVVYWNLPMFILLVTLFWLIGLVMYAVYHDCDPVVSKKIEKADQMVPLLVIDLLSFMPGIPGLFMSCVFSASLSSLSSGYNGSAAVVLKDFITPVYKHYKKKDMSDKLQTNISKGLATLFGVVTLALAFLILSIGSSIFALTSKITGMFGGPLAAVFFCGLLLPKLSNAGVMAGFIVSVSFSLWTGIGSIFYKPRWSSLPVSIEGCVVANMSSLLNMTTALPEVLHSSMTTVNPVVNATLAPEAGGFHFTDIYSLSPLIYGPSSTIIAIGSAIIFHFIFACAQSICCRRKYKALKGVQRQSSIIRYNYDENYEPTTQRSPKRGGRKWSGRQSEIRGLVEEQNSNVQVHPGHTSVTSV